MSAEVVLVVTDTTQSQELSVSRTSPPSAPSLTRHETIQRTRQAFATTLGLCLALRIEPATLVHSTFSRQKLQSQALHSQRTHGLPKAPAKRTDFAQAKVSLVSTVRCRQMSNVTCQKSGCTSGEKKKNCARFLDIDDDWLRRGPRLCTAWIPRARSSRSSLRERDEERVNSARRTRRQ